MKTLPVIDDAKKVFRKKGACSHSLFHIINRHFDNSSAAEERAADPLAGGILQKGYQCGMIWGALLGMGKEVFYRSESFEEALIRTVNISKDLLESFEETAGEINCRKITGCDFDDKWSMAKYLISGKFLHCFDLMEEWAPKAISVIEKGLENKVEASDKIANCASQTLIKMQALDEEIIMVAGFAGGIGLSGGACGALAASIWHATLLDILDSPSKSALKNTAAQRKYEAFMKLTNGEINCHKICNRKFKDINDHSAYIEDGGCSSIINVLAN